MTERIENKEGVNSYTHIGVVLDRSSSMQGTVQDTIGGFNQFLKDQKETGGKATITLVQFDHEYDILKEMEDLKSTTDLNSSTYVPRGNTALLDAIGRTITRTEAKISELNTESRPDKVIFVIITDGEENSSIEFTRDNVMEMIRRNETENHWQFVFIGANQDAIQAGNSIGVRATNSLTYGANSGGVRTAYMSMSRNMTSFRESNISDVASYSYFSSEDREAQEKHGVTQQVNTDDKEDKDAEDNIPPNLTKEQLAFYTSSK